MQNTRGRKNEFPGWISQIGPRLWFVEIIVLMRRGEDDDGRTREEEKMKKI